MAVEKPRRSAQTAMARVFLTLMSVALLKIDVLSVEGVTMSMSCRTKLNA
jgi:hypothetical protein